MIRRYVTCEWTTIISVAALGLGGAIYLCLRPATLQMFSWCQSLGIDSQVSFLREIVSGWRGLAPDWVVFSLPQGLWFFSGLLLLLRAWRGFDWRKCFFWCLAFIVMAFGSEFGQLPGILRGTYDSLDVMFLCVGLVAAIWVFVIDHSKVRRDYS